MPDVLVIHHDASARLSITEQLRRTNRLALGAGDLAQARIRLHHERAAVTVIIAAVPPGGTAVTLTQRVRGDFPSADLIVLARGIDTDDTADAIREGASVCLPLTAATDHGKLLQAIESASSRRQQTARARWRTYDHAGAESLDPHTREIFARADRAAVVDSTVLITGESGTGKEVLARRIHQRSSRVRFKFVPVNCGSLPESLIETELFGYRKGAFTGAAADTKGLIEEAEHGVLFLDEIGDMALSMQVRLLRFLDRGEIRPVGGTTVKHVDVRVIAATNRYLHDAIREKGFREDLFFRLSVVPLHLPPLRERKVDIPHLVCRHIERTAAKFCVQPPAVSEETLAVLIGYDWPGNIRELENALEHALVQCDGDTLTPAMLPSNVVRGRSSGGPTTRAGELGVDLASVLRQNNGNHTVAAAALGISRTTLWRRLKQRHGTASDDTQVATADPLGEEV